MHNDDSEHWQLACLWNQSWYRFCWPKRTRDVRKFSLFSMSGVSRLEKYRREVFIGSICLMPALQCHSKAWPVLIMAMTQKPYVSTICVQHVVEVVKVLDMIRKICFPLRAILVMWRILTSCSHICGCSTGVEQSATTDLLATDISAGDQVSSFPSVIWLTEIWRCPCLLTVKSSVSARHTALFMLIFVKCPHNC